VAPARCTGCGACLPDDGAEVERVRRQVADTAPPPPPKVTEYQVVSRRCRGCGHVSSPGVGDVARLPHRGTRGATGHDSAGTAEAPERTTDIERHPGGGLVPVSVLAPGSPVRIGPAAMATGALLTCAHYLPIGRAAALFAALTGMTVSTGFLAGIRHRAAALLETTFLPPHESPAAHRGRPARR